MRAGRPNLLRQLARRRGDLGMDAATGPDTVLVLGAAYVCGRSSGHGVMRRAAGPARGSRLAPWPWEAAAQELPTRRDVSGRAHDGGGRRLCPRL